MTRCRFCGTTKYELTAGQLAHREYACPTCRRAYQAKWREIRRAAGLPSSGSKTWDPNKRAAWKQRYFANPAIRARAAELQRQYSRDPRLRGKYEARWLVHRAIEAGRLVRKPCEKCGATRVDAHHDDYGKPLAVRWLCRACHSAEHHAKAEGRDG